MKSLPVGVLLLCAFALVVTQASSCLNDCSGHGSCHDSQCSCDSPYDGSDCSLFNQTVSSGNTYSGSVIQSGWQYYNIRVAPASVMTWWLNRTSSSGDCDLWIDENQVPSFNNYLYRNTSTRADLSLVVTSDNGGLYYAGVFGYRACSYTIQVTVETECPQNCHGHGHCVEQGVCQCNEGYYGVRCGNAVPVMTPDQEYTGSVSRSKWAYYRYTSDEIVDEIEWEMVRSNPNVDCDIYVREGMLPTAWEWNYANVSEVMTKTIKQSHVDVGQEYFFGVFGYSRSKTSCSFTVSLHVTAPSGSDDCPNHCSNHQQSCSSNVCHCNSGYSGSECETKDAYVELGQIYDGYVGDNAWNYYTVNGDDATGLLISLTKTSTSATSDPDLYIKAGQNPTRYDFDYLDISTADDMTVAIPQPVGNIWHIGVYGYYPSEYHLMVEDDEICPCVDSRHGSCLEDSPVCVCNIGYAGDDCSQVITPLSSTVPVVGTVANHQWQYYSIQSDSTSAASLAVVETQTQGLVWVFVSHQEPPSLTNYEYSDKESSALHQVSFSTREAVGGTLFIGVYGSPYIPDVTIDGTGTNVPFNISCWVSDF